VGILEIFSRVVNGFRIRNAILIFGVVNACLYSGLLPLWEGFDEAFHYSYVETLWQTHRLPVLGRTLLPADVHKSFEFAPVGPIVHISTPQATSYDEWVSLPPAEKGRRRKELDLLRPERESSSQPDYEAHQAPLAYVFLAVLDRSLSTEPITVRVAALRVFAAVLSTVLLYFGAMALFQAMQMPEQYANATLFTIFCSEMFYATVAHVANDWLAVGISALFFASLAEFVREPERRSALWSAVWLAAGLLTKAYFLAFGLLAFGTAVMLIWSRRARLRTVLAAALLVLVVAGPWYARNLVLYKNVSGSYEEFEGVGVRQALAAAPRIDWLATAGFLARGSIWTGNNSFTSFSRNTLNIVLVLLFTGLAAWGIRRKAVRTAEQAAFAGVVLFAIAVAYASCASFARTNGDVSYAGPWYTQVLLAPAIGLAYLGLSRWKRFGVVLGGISVAMWTWVLIATWTVKLFPMYSGGGASPMRVREVWNWWTHGAVVHAQDLSLLALAPASWLYGGLVVSVTLCLLVGVAVILDLNQITGDKIASGTNSGEEVALV
jgi:hypothetical protein